ncbi:hypothetical protein Tco_0881772 [Tanacetum coccineum]
MFSKMSSWLAVILTATAFQIEESLSPKRKVVLTRVIIKLHSLPLDDNIDKMADENVPAPVPARSDDQVLPFVAAFTASASVPAIYIQQFWNTLTYVEKAGTCRFQLDEDWFTLDANLLREALEITPIDQDHPFVTPPSGDAILDFMNELGYPQVRLLGMIGPDIQFFRCFGGLLQALMLTLLNLCGRNLYKLFRSFSLTRPI